LLICGAILAFAALAWIAGTPRGALRPREATAPPALDSNGVRDNPFLASGAPDRGWPFLRGPDYNGHSPEINLADSWPGEGPPVLWNRALGQGYSAFTAAGDRVFTQYQTLAGQYVICLTAETGETIWEYRYAWPYEAGGVYPGPRATPALADGRVYFAAPSGLVGCLSWAGELVWSVPTKEQFRGRGADFGYAASPTVHEGLVLLPVGGPGASVVALDARDGSTKWQAGDDTASYTPILPISIDGHRQVVAYLENALACFDEKRGTLLWRMELSQGYDEHAAWPLFEEPRLWISAPFRWGSTLLKLSADEDTPPETIWHSERLSNDVFSSVSHAGNLYGFDLRDVQAKTHRSSHGRFRCLDFETGEPRWETEQAGHTSVLVADGKLILFNDRGELILARATPEKYDELARVSVLTGEIAWTPPALDRGRLYVRNQHQAACIYIGRPELLERDRARPPLTVADIPQAEFHDMASILGVEPEYFFDVPTKELMRSWYFCGILILLAAGVAASAARQLVKLLFRKSMPDSTTWAAFWCLAFTTGAVALRSLSLWRNEFIFTWPVSLFVVFQAVMQEVPLTRVSSPDRTAAWRSRFAALLFVATCAGYYLLCRRLSLVFEWVFLGGFGAAVPLALAGRWLARRSPSPTLCRAASTMAEFSAYYWGSVLWLWWKYPNG
jgi:outer membrane protein assembly factor BamB